MAVNLELAKIEIVSVLDDRVQIHVKYIFGTDRILWLQPGDILRFISDVDPVEFSYSTDNGQTWRQFNASDGE